MGVVRETTRETLRLGTVRGTLGYGDGNGIPANALLDAQGNPILDAQGNYILLGG